MKFYDDAGNVRKDLYDTVAEGIANELSRDRNPAEITSTQLRRFFNEVKLFERRLRIDPEKRPAVFASKLPEIKMLKAKTAYALSRKNINERFHRFMKDCVDQVETAEDFLVFARLFEAVIGFASGKLKK